MIRVAGPARVSFTDQARNHPHRHTFFEPCLVLAGHGELEHADRRYELHPGDLFVADPGVVHEIRSERTRDLEVAFTSFSVAAKKPGTAVSSSAVSASASTPADAVTAAFLAGHDVLRPGAHALVHSFNAAFEMATSPVPLVRGVLVGEMMHLIVLQIMASLSALSPAGPAAPTGPLDRALAAIDAAVSEGRHIDTTAVAAAAGVSERTLRRAFRAQLGHGLSAELQRRRVLAAASLLFVPELSCTEVGRRVGVPDPGQFSRLFRKVMGISPTEYRRIHGPVPADWVLGPAVPLRTEFLDAAQPPAAGLQSLRQDA